jgi:hypothetical protein
MRFYKLQLPGVVLVEPEFREDERGGFARTWCQREFAVEDLDTRLVQCSVAWSAKKGTLRGMYYQDAPHAESRLIRCTRGSVYVVAVDLRPHTPTFKRWEGADLTAENRRALYVPAGWERLSSYLPMSRLLISLSLGSFSPPQRFSFCKGRLVVGCELGLWPLLPRQPTAKSPARLTPSQQQRRRKAGTGGFSSFNF